MENNHERFRKELGGQRGGLALRPGARLAASLAAWLPAQLASEAALSQGKCLSNYCRLHFLGLYHGFPLLDKATAGSFVNLKSASSCFKQ